MKTPYPGTCQRRRGLSSLQVLALWGVAVGVFLYVICEFTRVAPLQPPTLPSPGPRPDASRTAARGTARPEKADPPVQPAAAPGTIAPPAESNVPAPDMADQQAGISMNGGSISRTEKPVRKSMPAKSDQDAVVRQLDELFPGMNDKKPEEQMEFARRMMEMANESSRPEERFVLWRVAAETAARLGEFSMMLEAMESIGREFEVDVHLVAGKLLGRFRPENAAPDQRQSLIEQLLELSARMKNDRQLDLALQMAEKANELASGAPDALRSQVVELTEGIRFLLQRRAEYDRAIAVLTSDRNNSDAHLTTGLWLACQENDWDRALPHFVKGADLALQKAASVELAAVDSPESQLGVADHWWDASRLNSDAGAAGAFRDRALNWYRRCLPGLSGLAKAKAESRIESACEPPAASKPLTPSVPVAAASSKPAARLSKTDPAGSLIEEAYRACAAGDEKTAKAKLIEARKLEPNDYRIEFTNALIDANKGALTDAETHFQNCISKTTDDAPIRNNCALICVRRRAYSQAISQWKKVLEDQEAPLPEVVQNIGRFKDLVDRRQIVLSGEALHDLMALHSKTKDAQSARYQSNHGWMFCSLRNDSGGILGNLPPDAFEDSRCAVCGGSARVKCPGGCTLGSVRGYRAGNQVYNPLSGQHVVGEKVPVRVPCKVCDGNGTVKCPACRNGTDPQLAKKRS